MSNSHLYKIINYTLLSEAAYANFWDDKVDTQITDLKQIAFCLIDKEVGKTWLDPKGNGEKSAINIIVDNYDIISHQPNTASGFSATLFQEFKRDRSGNIVEKGEYVLAIRGTEHKTKEDIGTDVGDITFDGLAVDQIVDLYNFFQKLVTPETENYKIASLNIDQEKTDRYRELFREL